MTPLPSPIPPLPPARKPLWARIIILATGLTLAACSGGTQTASPTASLNGTSPPEVTATPQGTAAPGTPTAIPPTLAPTPSQPEITATLAPKPTALYLNEAMSDNETALASADGSFSDWIELYNASDTDVPLAGMGLSDDADDPFQMVFPNVSVPARGFLLIWASGDGGWGPGGEVHTPFRLSNNGETLILTHATGEVDRLELPPLGDDTSLGRTPDGSPELATFNPATPGAPNGDSGTPLPTQRPALSLPGGFYAAAISLDVDAAPAATVRYTLDGSIPTEASPSFDGPLELAPRAGTANGISEIPTNSIINDGTGFVWKPPKHMVDKAWVVRARAFEDGRSPSATVTQTYFIDEGAPAKYAMPVVSLATDEDNLFGYERGIYVPGQAWQMAEDTRLDAGQPPYADALHPANYHNEGREWERPVHVELYEADGSLGFVADAGVRIHGNTSRAYPFKSLRFYFRSEYGANKLEYPLFPEHDTDTFKRLVLRNSGGDFGGSLLRDALNQSHWQDEGVIDISAYRASLLFVNGEYWGIHNWRERHDEDYLAIRYDLDPDDVVILRDSAVVADEGVALDHGVEEDREPYLALRDFVATEGAVSEANYAWIQSQMDVDDFIDYNLAEIWCQNLDWPHKNVRFWRLRTDAPFNSGTQDPNDGRWRWLIFDTDHSLHDPAHNTLHNATTQTPNSGATWSTVLLRGLMANPDFAQRFMNRAADALNTFLAPEAVNQRMVAMAEIIDPNIGRQVNRWQYPGGKGGWENRLAGFAAFAEARPDALRQHIVDYFGLEGTAPLTLTIEGEGQVRINTVTLPAGTQSWSGTYFNPSSISLTALPAPGHHLDEWSGDGSGEDPTLTVTMDGAKNITVVFETGDSD